MNLLDALKTEREFRRPNWPPDQKADTVYQITSIHSSSSHSKIALSLWDSQRMEVISLSSEDLTANDWELIEQKVTFTKEQLLTAMHRAWFDCPGFSITSIHEATLKYLGFK